MAIIDNPVAVSGGEVDQTSALKWMLENKSSYFGIAAGMTTLTELPTFTQPSTITEFESAFRGCTNLTAVDIDLPARGGSGSSYKYVNLSHMFYDCTSLTSALANSSIPYYNLFKCDCMFYNCYELVDFPAFTDLRATSYAYMFYNCRKMSSFSGYIEDLATSYERMFSGCTSLTSVTIRTGYTKLSQATDVKYMFYGCTSLTESGITVPPFSRIQNASGLFYDCTSLTSVSTTLTDKFIAAGVTTDVGSMFRGCTNLTSVGITYANTSAVTRFGDMFRNCTSLTAVPQLDTSSGTRFSYMFRGCTSLTTVPQLDTSSGTRFDYMFYDCTNLTTVPVLDFSGVSATASYHQNIFSGCTSLSNVSLNNILASLVTMTNPTTSLTLKYIGLTSEQATTCTGLSNWAAAEAAGWTTGY